MAQIRNSGTDPSLYPIILTSPNAQENGYFGLSVAASGNTVVVGASYETAFDYSEAGNAYIFSATTGALIKTLTSPNAQTDGWFGSSIAMSGSIVVVGAPGETALGDQEAGHAYIFNATTGSLIETLTSPKSQKYGFFGSSVSLSGSIVVVGAPDEKVSGYKEAGYAYIFNATTGDLIKRLTSPNAQKDGLFGFSVAISGKTVVVGAYGETLSGYEFGREGRAYIFNAKSGSLISTLISPNAQSGGQFGDSVAISGTTVVVGAYYETVSGYLQAGHAYTFNANTGSLISTLSSPNAQNYGWFGCSVAVSGSNVVVGAYYETVSGYEFGGEGHAYIFSATTGALISTLISPNAQSYGYFGYSVAVSGSTVVAGAYHETASGYPAAGHAYRYIFLLSTLTSPNAQSMGDFGYSVATNGTTVVVGAPGETASGYVVAGHAYIFDGKTDGLITLTSPNAQTDGEFGYSIAISGTTIVVGAYCEIVSGYGCAGQAYTFNAKTGGLVSTLFSPNAQTNGWFGYSLATNGTTVVVGAPGETASGYENAGRAYTFSAKTGALIDTLSSPNAQSYGEFGTSVAISGTTIVVGAPLEDVLGYDAAGHAYTFNATSGALINTFTSPNAQSSGGFGSSVAVSINTIVVGASAESVSGYSQDGRAYTFDAVTGVLINTLTSSNQKNNGFFGTSVAISGTTIAVGAIQENASGYEDAGRVYTFNANTGSLISALTSPNAQTGGWFGISVAVSGTTVVVGACYETVFGFGTAGHAYIF